MDAVGLIVLLKEIEADEAVIDDAARKADLRLRDRSETGLEACAYQLTRLYNTLEKILERICVGFENHFDKRGDYHERLIQRVSLNVPGIRPAFIPAARVNAVRELKGFRHVPHAYDLELRQDRLEELVVLAGQLAMELPAWRENFGNRTKLEQGWN